MPILVTYPAPPAPPSGPTDVVLIPTNPTIPTSTLAGSVVGAISAVGGVGPYTYAITNGNLKFQVSGSQLQLSAAGQGNITNGTQETIVLQATDSLSHTSPTHSYQVNINNGAPTDVTLTPSSPTVLSNSLAGSTVGIMGAVGGVAPYTYAIVNGNTKFQVSGSNLQISATGQGNLSPGTQETVVLQVTDANSQTSPTHSYQVSIPAAPTNITHSPDAILDNATAGTVATFLNAVGGAGGGGWTKVSGLSFFDFVTATGPNTSLALNSSGVGHLVPGTPQTGVIRYTDAAGLSPPDLNLSITVQDHSASTLIETKQLINRDAVTFPANSFATMDGLQFAPGEIASGTWPQIRLNDGVTVVPTTFLTNMASFHPDGSLAFVPALYRVPASITAGATINLKVYSNGTLPAVSGLTLAGLAATTDFRITSTGFMNLSGTWTSYLNHGINNTNQAFPLAQPDIEMYGDGPAGFVCCVRASFEQGGAPHGQLEAYWFLQVLCDENGAFAGVRRMEWVCQPWYNNDTPAKNARAFSSLAITETNSGYSYDTFTGFFGAANLSTLTSITLRDTKQGSLFNVTGSPQRNAMLLFYHTDGTPPSGLTNDTNYWCITETGGFTLYPTSIHPSGGSGAPIYVTTQGTGTQTFTPYPYLVHAGGYFTAPSTGKYQFAQAGGTRSADYNTQIKFSLPHLLTTNLILPYRTNPSVPALAPATNYPYYSQSFGPLVRYIGQTGERSDIAPLNEWNTRHIQTQSLDGDMYARVIGLVGSHAPVIFKSKEDHCIPNVLRASYSGMTQNVNLRWNGPGGASGGFTVPPTTPCPLMACTEPDASHNTMHAYWPYLFTGEPQFWHVLMHQCMSTIFQTSPKIGTPSPALADATGNSINGRDPTGIRTKNINGTIYDGVLWGDGQQRADGWRCRNLFYALFLTGPNCPQNNIYRQHLSDFVDTTAAGCAAFINMNTPFCKLTGILTQQPQSAWQRNYGFLAWAHLAKMRPTADTITVMNHMAKYNPWISNAVALQHVAGYADIIRKTPADSDSPLIESVDEWGTSGPNGTCVAGSSDIALAGSFIGWTPLPVSTDVFFLQSTVAQLPTISVRENMYVVAYDGTGTPNSTNKGKVQLSDTPGGPPLVAATSGVINGIGNMFFRATDTWAPGSYKNPDYFGESSAGSQAAKWAGSTTYDETNAAAMRAIVPTITVTGGLYVNVNSRFDILA